MLTNTLRLSVLTLTAAVLLTGCQRKSVNPDDLEFDVLLPCTPVKNQGRSETCWAYAMLATIETEHLLRGDSVNLSAVYVRRMLPEYRKSVNGKSVNGNSVNSRAMCQTLLNMAAIYGLALYDALPDDAVDELPTPRMVFMLGAQYTPQELAHSVCAPGEYVSLTCVADSPYYRKVCVPTADNWERNRMLNIPADSLRSHVDRALLRRHPVCWESAGHAMAIVGKAHDKSGRQYYIMKNSWSSRHGDGGFDYMPADEAVDKAVAVYMTRDAYNGQKQ